MVPAYKLWWGHTMGLGVGGGFVLFIEWCARGLISCGCVVVLYKTEEKGGDGAMDSFV